MAALSLTLVLSADPSRADVLSRTTPEVAAIGRIERSVVSISSEKKAASTSRWPFSSEESTRPTVNGMGTGVIVDGRGYIITNHHVVDKVQGIEVHLHDGTRLPARVIQADKEMDLAVVKVDAGKMLSPAAIGTSSDLRLGETVLTMGNAFGYENTVSKGIVSALKRNVTLSDDQKYFNLIQTDACINPGNSGGPLINIDGELIGINVATRSGAQGIGFALPIDDVKRVATEMMSTRRLTLKWHGLVSNEVWQNNDRRLILSEVPSNSPAEAAGFRVGDQLVRVGDLAVTSPLDVERGFLDAPSGQPIKVAFRREGRDLELPLQLQPMTSRAKVASGTVAPAVGADPIAQVYRALGLKVTAVDAGYVAAANARLHGGLYVEAVNLDGPGARASIQKGDILVGMHVGARHWETVRPDDVLFVLNRPEVAQADLLPFYFVRSNTVYQGAMSLADLARAGGIAVR